MPSIIHEFPKNGNTGTTGAEPRALSKPLIFQGHGEVYKISLPQMTRFFPGFLLALHRQVRKITIFTPQPPGTGDSSRCKLDPCQGSRYVDANRGYSAPVRLGGPGGFSLPGNDPPLSRGHPRLRSSAGSAGGAGTGPGRLFRLPPLGRRRAHPALAASLL